METVTSRQSVTPIQQFYSGSSVFITGGTGFLGKILIEKLLRSCPDIAALYILVRNKKGKNLHARVDELFEDVIFDRLREEFPKFKHKVFGVGGDCSLPELGLSMQDRQLLIDEVSVVFHVAATVRFDEKLKLAVVINVKGPQEIMNLCKLMPNLKAAVHVSTAYSNCPFKVIEERFYQPPIDYKKLMVLTESIPDKILDNITPTILDKWPNSYTYTKAIAEDVVRHEGRGMPVAVFRPAIVISTYREPIKGWINNLYGPTGVCAGAGTGLIRTLHCDRNVNANVIPVDMCVNALIATAWEVAEDYRASKSQNGGEYEMPVYQYESSNQKPITWGRFMHLSEHYGMLTPSVKAIWYYCLTLQKSALVYFMTIFCIHYLPALMTDMAMLCVGKPPRLLNIYKKIHKFSKVISYFCLRNWIFRSSRVQKLCKRMSEKDKEIFFCDLNELVWEEFFKEYLKGIRIHLIRDPLDTLKEAHVKWRRFYWLHQAFKLLVTTAFLYILWYVLNLMV